MTPILTADCVAKSYGARRVLSSATLRAEPGELRVLFGRNGVGKSTLLKIAAGWLAPDSGCVHFDGRAYPSVSLPRLASRGLFYLPDHDLLSSAFSVRHQLEMFRVQFSGEHVVRAAEQLGIAQCLDLRPSALSGGERRRAELAAVLVRRPRCRLADEPFRGIAPKDADDLIAIFAGLAHDGVAVILTGHEVPTLLRAADHISWCTSGTTYELGPPALATQHDLFRSDYLGSWAQ
ncbi:MAG TPA: ATP-binding cassette domain-containing protein [Gemmatimonadaceae bacterium]|nr:ATP-binding cassette domain-containing protein [Gemmatimonadaceae bacterium]